MRHRAILHSSFGIYICEKVFGHNITLQSGKLVSVRDIAEQHVIDDMGRIPTVQDYLIRMPFYEWLGGAKRERQVTKITEAAPSLDEIKRALQVGAEDTVFDSAAMPGKLVVD